MHGFPLQVVADYSVAWVSCRGSVDMRVIGWSLVESGWSLFLLLSHPLSLYVHTPKLWLLGLSCKLNHYANVYYFYKVSILIETFLLLAKCYTIAVCNYRFYIVYQYLTYYIRNVPKRMQRSYIPVKNRSRPSMCMQLETINSVGMKTFAEELKLVKLLQEL